MFQRSNQFLDFNSGAPVHPKVREALFLFLNTDPVGNPSSVHFYGRNSKKIIHQSKKEVFDALEIDSKQYTLEFTSSGTEANQLALYSHFKKFNKAPHLKKKLITSKAEHLATLSFLPYLKAQGVEVVFVPHLRSGDLDYDFLNQVCDEQTSLVSLLWVNNETGVIYDVPKIKQIVSNKNIPLHLDAAQAVGKVPLKLAEVPIDYLSFSGHKIGGLPGSGILLVKGNESLEFFHKRGTANLISIFSLGKAIKEINPIQFQKDLQPLQSYFENKLKNEIPSCELNALECSRVANTTHISFPFLKSKNLVMELDLMGFSVSAGSACQSGQLEPSHVLIALGMDQARTERSIRVSYAPSVQKEVFDEFIAALRKLR